LLEDPGNAPFTPTRTSETKMSDPGAPLADPELELRAHIAGVNFATQILLHMHDDMCRRLTGFSPDWAAVAANLEAGVTQGDDPYVVVNRRGRYIASAFMRETEAWSRNTGSPGPEPTAGLPPKS
jgi:hypothetical protein